MSRVKTTKVSATKSQVIQAIDAMSGDLLEVYKRLQSLVKDGVNNLIDYYMKVGAEVVEVQKHLDVYGDSALTLLTKALIINDESTLRRAAQVRGFLTEADIEKIKKKNESHMRDGGSPVTWSHLQTMTYNVTTRRQLLDYVELVWEKDLSVRELRALISGGTDRAEPAVPALPGGISRSTDNISARSHSLVAIIDKYSEFFADDDVVQTASQDEDFKAKAAVAAGNLRKLAEHAIAQADNLSRIANAQPAQLALPAAPPPKPVSETNSSGGVKTSPDPNKTRRPV